MHLLSQFTLYEVIPDSMQRNYTYYILSQKSDTPKSALILTVFGKTNNHIMIT